MTDRFLARLQSWLQGVPNKPRPWWVVRIGNLISDGRYWVWRARGGTHEAAVLQEDAFDFWFATSNVGAYLVMDPIENTATNATHISWGGHT